MKKNFTTLVMTALPIGLFLCIIMASCVTIETNDARLLVGTWEERVFISYAQQDAINTLTMKDDNTFEWNFNGSYLNGQGQYTLEGGNTDIQINIFDLENSSVDKNSARFLTLKYSPQQTTHVFLVEELSKTKLVMRDDHQTQHTFTKK